MLISGEDEKQGVGGEEFWKPLEDHEKMKESGRIKSMFNNLPMATIILILLVVIVDVIVILLGLKISTLKAEIDEMKGLKTQITTMEVRLGEVSKNREKTKNELALIRSDLETLKVQMAQVEAALQKQAAGRKNIATQKPISKNKRP
jgi:septal ring factor EnvC (AmiA/AmiB activator)